MKELRIKKENFLFGKFIKDTLGSILESLTDEEKETLNLDYALYTRMKDKKENLWPEIIESINEEDYFRLLLSIPSLDKTGDRRKPYDFAGDSYIETEESERDFLDELYRQKHYLYCPFPCVKLKNNPALYTDYFSISCVFQNKKYTTMSDKQLDYSGFTESLRILGFLISLNKEEFIFRSAVFFGMVGMAGPEEFIEIVKSNTFLSNSVDKPMKDYLNSFIKK